MHQYEFQSISEYISNIPLLVASRTINKAEYPDRQYKQYNWRQRNHWTNLNFERNQRGL
jgi:hypothetical protein